MSEIRLSVATNLLSILDSCSTHLQSCTGPQIQRVHASTHACIISSKMLPCVIFAVAGYEPAQNLPERTRSQLSSCTAYVIVGQRGEKCGTTRGGVSATLNG